ncbi:hypothetical protein LI064_15815 [Clostridium perfringens]|uniref:hypothetical protein n=1 Tax=Clostridium perfringens TaxID=1502 RepID=UPI0022485DB3|nr:hypothetical protein [Clostridium perfringens]MCX0355982.1 hypothetical protein [Clostridium perfringens]MDM0612647.1 hypothetical protein [Clostridium perfringens]
MRRYIWLGDSKYGGSVYWDKKRKLALRNEFSKASATKGKLSIIIFIGTLILLLMLRLFFFSDNDIEKVNNISVMLFTIFFTILFTYLINHLMYGSHKDYEKTTLEDAMHAIKSTGYLQNPFIYMLLDKKLHIMVISILILFGCSGLCQLSPKLKLLQNIIKIPFMIFFIGTPIRMVYLVNFKKDNRLKL